jgi:hypothetical protein
MELGRLAHLSAEERREFARRGGIARQRKAAAERKALIGLTLLDNQFPAIEWPPIEGDSADHIERVWAPALVRAWQECLDCARRSGNVGSMVRVLSPMTAMCPPLASLRAPRDLADPMVMMLPSNVDLFHLTDDEPEHITGLKLGAEPIAGTRRKPRKSKLGSL